MCKRINNTLQRMEKKLDLILWYLHIEHKEMRVMGKEIDTLIEDVAANSTVVGSAIVLLNDLTFKIQEAIEAGDVSMLVPLAADLEAQTRALADAVAANTPAAPPVV